MRLFADGWGFSQISQVNSLKMSVIGGIHAVQYFRSETLCLSSSLSLSVFFPCHSFSISMPMPECN